MGIKTVEFNGVKYPAYQADGNSVRFVAPYIDEVCKADKDKGEFGYNIGCGAWNYPPDAIPIDIILDDGKYHALNLPKPGASYVTALHLLEHLPNYVEALKYWTKNLKVGGTLFLFLPHRDQKRWLPQHNPRHLHIFYPEDIVECLKDLGYINIFYSERDLYHGFSVFGEKG